jgi:hypothetical protein
MRQQHRSRDLAATAIRADGRRVPQTVRTGDVSVSFLGLIEAIRLGILALITGSRRESGG